MNSATLVQDPAGAHLCRCPGPGERPDGADEAPARSRRRQGRAGPYRNRGPGRRPLLHRLLHHAAEEKPRRA